MGKHRHKKKAQHGGGRSSTGDGRATAPTSAPVSQVLDLQSKAGNAAVAESAKAGGPPLSQKEIAQRIRAGQQRRTEERQQEHDDKYGWFGSETWLGWGLEKITGKHEGDSVGKPGDEEASESEAKGLFEMLAPEVEIALAEKEFAGQLAGGDLTGKVGLSSSLEGFKGSAEVAWQNGSEASVTSEPLTYGIYGTSFTGTGTLSSFEGVQFKAKGEIDSEHAEIDLRYFDGSTISAGTDIKLKIGDRELVAAKGSVGFASGSGGRFFLKYTFAEGSITLSTGSTTALAGVGLTWDYEIEFKTQAIVKSLWDWLPSWSTLWGYVSSATGVFGYGSTATSTADAGPGTTTTTAQVDPTSPRQGRRGRGGRRR